MQQVIRDLWNQVTASRLIIPVLACGLLVTGTAVFLVDSLSRGAAEEAVVVLAEQHATQIGEHLNHHLAKVVLDQVASGDVLKTSDLDDTNGHLTEAVRNNLVGLQISKLHMFAPGGRILFSTDRALIGTQKQVSEPFHTAASGRAASKLERQYTPDAIGVAGATRDITETYLPLWDNPELPEGQRELIGVLELYQDVGAHLAISLAANHSRLAIVISTLGLLFMMLCVVVLRLERALRQSVAAGERLEAERARSAAADAHSQELQVVNDELTQRTHQAEQASRAKSLFLANMSHELRTPLNAVIGFADVLHREMVGPLEEDQKDMVMEIHGAGKHLLTIISDVLDIARIEAGKLQVDTVRCSLAEIMGESIRVARPLAEAKAQELSATVEPDMMDVTGDPVRLKQMVLNLVSNAIKFTPAQGKVQLAVGVWNGMAQLSVVDTGPGVPLELQEVIFDKFERIERRGAHTLNEGTGLGLALTRQLAELQGGEVGCESTPGEGSHFWFTVPLAQSWALPSDDRLAQELAA